MLIEELPNASDVIKVKEGSFATFSNMGVHFHLRITPAAKVFGSLNTSNNIATNANILETIFSSCCRVPIRITSVFPSLSFSLLVSIHHLMSSMHISAVRTAVSWSIRESAINKVGCHRHKHVHLVGGRSINSSSFAYIKNE